MHALHNYNGVPILYTFLDMSQPSVVCLNGLRSAGVGIVGVRSAGVGIANVRSAGVGHRSRKAHRRRASMLVYIKGSQQSCLNDDMIDPAMDSQPNLNGNRIALATECISLIPRRFGVYIF